MHIGNTFIGPVLDVEEGLARILSWTGVVGVDCPNTLLVIRLNRSWSVIRVNLRATRQNKVSVSLPRAQGLFLDVVR